MDTIGLLSWYHQYLTTIANQPLTRFPLCRGQLNSFLWLQYCLSKIPVSINSPLFFLNSNKSRNPLWSTAPSLLSPHKAHSRSKPKMVTAGLLSSEPMHLNLEFLGFYLITQTFQLTGIPFQLSASSHGLAFTGNFVDQLLVNWVLWIHRL